MKKIAVILFNLGGPDNQKAVRPFLFNLFHDPAIIGLPQPFRYLIATLLSRRRAPIARVIYGKINGGSPILKNTRDQAAALEKKLNEGAAENYKCFIAMRYWHPFADACAREVAAYAPDEIILLPLYPQYSTTTTASSVKDWQRAARQIKVNVPTRTICCYPQQAGFIRALADLTRRAYEQASRYGKPRVLFSAHGLPEKIIQQGDPYQFQCEQTAEALRAELNIADLDSVLCFQSRVGPLQWIGPATDDEIRRAAADKIPLVAVPVAFVSDHSETLVEIDIEYRHLAMEKGAPFFVTVAAVGAAPDFIAGLAEITRASLNRNKQTASADGACICPPQFSGCACKQNL